jgi:hypothetical protein
LLSDEHFTVDGTLLEAWASQKSFRRRDSAGDAAPPEDPQNPTVNYRGERRRNATHRSTTDPDARLYRKTLGQPAQLAHLGQVVSENRHGLIVDPEVTLATGQGERDAGAAMLPGLPRKRCRTLSGDKNYDTREFAATMRHHGITPHVGATSDYRPSAQCH